jgi:GT2 family glycosyltransferase
MGEPGTRTATSVAVVLLNYNGHDDTRECLASLSKATCKDLCVIVCDNGSTTAGLDALENEHPGVRFIRNARNLGFAGGCNVGIAAALEAGAAHVVLLNNDTIVSPGFVEPLLRALGSNPRAGIAGGTVLQWDNGPSDRIWYAGGQFSKLRGEISRPGYGQSFTLHEPPEVVETGFVSGCFAMIPARVLRVVGRLDEDFFFGTEDLDYTWRLERQGFCSLYVPASIIWHRSGRSRALDAGEVRRAYAAKLLLQRKHRPRVSYWAWLAAYTVYMRLAGLRRSSRRLADLGYARGTAREVRRGIDRALRDAWRGSLDTRAGLPT